MHLYAFHDLIVHVKSSYRKETLMYLKRNSNSVIKLTVSAIAIAAVLSGLGARSWASSSANWKIDSEMRFNFAYLPSVKTNGALENVASPLLRSAEYAPDISNIGYDGLLKLGFPLPEIEKPEDHRFLIKLFTFPSRLNPSLSAHRALDPFHLELIQGGKELIAFSDSREHLAVKFSVVDQRTHGDYTKELPLPTFSLPREQRLAQSDFDSNIPFTSIYLNPNLKANHRLTVVEQAKSSAQGVVAFHHDLLQAYRSSLIELLQTKDRFVFAELRRCVASQIEICGVHLIEIQKDPFVFQNFKDLPMPHDPNKVFLSGLLLVKTTELGVRPGSDLEKVDQSSLDSLLKKARILSSQVLEVGSVLDLRDQK